MSSHTPQSTASSSGRSAAKFRSRRGPSQTYGIFAIAAAALALTACIPDPNEVAMEVAGAPVLEEGKTASDLRNMQTRHFDTLATDHVMQAGLQVLQDLGFTVIETSEKSGLLVGTKQRSAEETGQIAEGIALSILLTLISGQYYTPIYDEEQTIYAIIVVSPLQDSEQTEVRASFERRLINNHKQLWRTEFVTDMEIYQEFFAKMSSAVFLEAHQS